MGKKKGVGRLQFIKRSLAKLKAQREVTADSRAPQGQLRQALNADAAEDNGDPRRSQSHASDKESPPIKRSRDEVQAAEAKMALEARLVEINERLSKIDKRVDGFVGKYGAKLQAMITSAASSASDAGDDDTDQAQPVKFLHSLIEAAEELCDICLRAEEDGAEYIYFSSKKHALGFAEFYKDIEGKLAGNPPLIQRLNAIRNLALNERSGGGRLRHVSPGVDQRQHQRRRAEGSLQAQGQPDVRVHPRLSRGVHPLEDAVVQRLRQLPAGLHAVRRDRPLDSDEPPAQVHEQPFRVPAPHRHPL
uniref:Uncharacterized protein n=1 Tax=Neobodo designis TaxID=312471 RepID=A0A7S1QEY6_NEODS|mmetsp:Transcript_41365/g.127863  ORF Transcript_41365/g.127863 Transcript_41365/m.127863 type:complete len:305 (+) Transcript_41365:29-943(+)